MLWRFIGNVFQIFLIFMECVRVSGFGRFIGISDFSFVLSGTRSVSEGFGVSGWLLVVCTNTT